MVNTSESISHIRIGETEFPIDAVTVQGKSLPDENSLLPIVSSADEDKILMVLRGQWGMYNPGDLYDLINGIPCGDSSYIPDWGDSESEGPIDYPNEYLTFEVLTPGDIIWKEHGSTAKTIQYSKNGGEWISITSTSSPRTIPVVAGGVNPAYYCNKSNTAERVITISASGYAGFVKLYYERIWASDCSFIDSSNTDFLHFIYCYLKYNQNSIYNMQKGSAQQHVYAKDINAMDLCIPSVNLLKLFEGTVSKRFDTISSLQSQIRLLTEARDRLLPKLMSGEIEA